MASGDMVRRMANEEHFLYLTEPLREVARHHLEPDEQVLTAIYVERDTHLAHIENPNLRRARVMHYPRRAFVLTTGRALIVEDPTDPAASHALQEHLIAICPLDRMIFFELRSHLLDCALTVVMATSQGPERVTMAYNGVIEHAFLAALACMRALIDDLPLPPYTRANEAYMRAREQALQEWHPRLAALGMRQENAVARYLVAGEQVQEWLKLPAIDERTWWQRFGIGAREQPPAVLVRTHRQVLLVKETKRIVHGEVTYGSDAWIMPQRSLREAYLVADQNRQIIQFHLERAAGAAQVHLPILPTFAEQALALTMPSFTAHGQW